MERIERRRYFEYSLIKFTNIWIVLARAAEKWLPSVMAPIQFLLTWAPDTFMVVSSKWNGFAQRLKAGGPTESSAPLSEIDEVTAAV